eukprot:gene7481-1338_t
MKEYDFYLFDFDGCLAHTIDIIIKSFEHTLGTLGQQREASVLRAAIGKPLKQQYMELLGSEYGDERIQDVLEVHRKFQEQNWPGSVYLHQNVKETLTKLQEKGKKMAIVTSRTYPSLEMYARPALKALESLGGSAPLSVFVGDASVDVLCGARAGMDTAWVPHGVGYLEPGVTPTHSMIT